MTHPTDAALLQFELSAAEAEIKIADEEIERLKKRAEAAEAALAKKEAELKRADEALLSFFSHLGDIGVDFDLQYPEHAEALNAAMKRKSDAAIASARERLGRG